MNRWRLQYPLTVMCRVFNIARSGFYDWLHRKPSRRVQEDERLKIAIKAAHKRTRKSYSARRLQVELAADGFQVGRDRIVLLRKELNIRWRKHHEN